MLKTFRFLVHSLFLTCAASLDDDGHQTVLLQDPIPMDYGKTAWHAFQARLRLPHPDFQTLYSLGHRGLALYFYCWDRALWSAVARIVWHGPLGSWTKGTSERSAHGARKVSASRH